MTNELASALAAAAARRDVTTLRPLLLDAASPHAAVALDALLDEPGIVVVDELAAQLEQIVRGRAPRAELSATEARAAVERLLDGADAGAFGTWAFYPWSRRLVHVLP